MSLSPARLHALHSIDQRDLPGWPAESLPRLRPIELRDSRDVDLSGRIVVGVVKRMLAIRHEIAALSGRPIERVDVAAQKILAVALEQLRSLDRVPAHAIVDDAVEQTKRIGPRGAAGFVNAILRKAAANRGKPIEAVGNALEQAERLHSIPKDVFAKLAKLYGEADALEMAAGFNREPPTLARLIGGATIDALGTPALPHAAPGVVVLSEARRDDLARLADANLAQVQDATSVATVDALDLRPGQRVLDRCSGRGTKTRQILERVGPDGQVVAMDTSADRLASLRATLKPAIEAGTLRVVAGGAVASLGDESKPFDRVLIDAPCSNSGVLARRPEARYRQSPRDLREVANLQATILADTANLVAPGGLLVYATCSIWPEENEGMVDRFLARDGRFELVDQRGVAPAPTADPTRYHDGGYAATLRRTS